MRAVRYFAWNEEPRCVEVPIPQPESGESLVRIEAATLTHLDLTVSTGGFGIRPSLPYTPGVEGAGVIVVSDDLAPGLRVTVRGGDLGLGRDGTWAEYAVVPNELITAIAADLSSELAAAAYDPATTAWIALHEVGMLGAWGALRIDLAEQEVVVVTGASGAVGSMATQVALRSGARVIALVSDTARSPLVPLGAEVVTPNDAATRADLEKSRAVTLVIDTVGGASTLARSRWVAPGGRVVVLGYTAGVEASVDLPQWLLDDVALLPLNMMRREASADAVAPELYDLLMTGALTLRVQPVEAEHVPDALRALASGAAQGRPVLVW